MRLTHRLVEVFRAVIATGNITRAAEILHSSQPTVSREIARLEQVVGMRLFDRVRGRLQPTARAIALFDEVERSFVGLEQIASTAESLRQFTDGKLALACLPALAESLVPAACAIFLAEHPTVGVSITPQESPVLEEWLGAQRFDLGLIEHLDAPADTAVDLLVEADEVAILPAGHRLLARKTLRPKDFSDEAFVSFAPLDPYRRTVDRMFAEHGVERRMVVETASAASVCALVRQGIGLAIVNPLTAIGFDGEGLHWRLLSFSIPYRIVLARPRRRPSTPLVDQFAKALRRAAKGLPGTRPQ
jgi:DNA-binding transcriptional LysR family regulator